MKRSAIKRKTPLKRRAMPRPKLTKADPRETERDFVRRLLAANASLHAERKARKPLPKQSARGKARNAEYARVRATWLADKSGQCEVRWFYGRLANIDEMGAPACPYPAVDVHHRAGRRGAFLCNVSWWICVCRQCHDYLHAHAREARRLGYLVTVKQP